LRPRHVAGIDRCARWLWSKCSSSSVARGRTARTCLCLSSRWLSRCLPVTADEWLTDHFDAVQVGLCGFLLANYCNISKLVLETKTVLVNTSMMESSINDIYCPRGSDGLYCFRPSFFSVTPITQSWTAALSLVTCTLTTARTLLNFKVTCQRSRLFFR